VRAVPVGLKWEKGAAVELGLQEVVLWLAVREVELEMTEAAVKAVLTAGRWDEEEGAWKAKELLGRCALPSRPDPRSLR
jgi:hypothetical protein